MIEIEIVFWKMTFFPIFWQKVYCSKLFKEWKPPSNWGFSLRLSSCCSFPIFVALKILDHVETAVVTPSLGFQQMTPLKNRFGHGLERYFWDVSSMQKHWFLSILTYKMRLLFFGRVYFFKFIELLSVAILLIVLKSFGACNRCEERF